MECMSRVHARGRGGSGFLIATVVWLQTGGKETSDKMDPDFPNDGSFSITMQLRVPPSQAVPLALSEVALRGGGLGAPCCSCRAVLTRKKMDSHVHS